MKKSNALLGAEPSGHIIFGNQYNTGDGILTAINLMRVLADTGKNPEELYHLYEAYPSVVRNIPVQEKIPFENLPKTSDTIKNLAKEANTHIHVRYSGTEPVLRIRIEGKNKSTITQFADEIVQVIAQEMNQIRSPGTATVS